MLQFFIISFLFPIADCALYRTYTFTLSQQRQIIQEHNDLRLQEPAANMQEMVWDEGLAALARDHASRCDAWHRDTNERRGHGYSYIGENIWWSNERYLRRNLKSTIRDFYNEKPYFDFDTLYCQPGVQCGHYTQVVWADTCAVGCAASYCNGIRNGRGIRVGHILVCNYGEGGNKGTQPYVYGTPCSRCNGRCTSQGLCESQCRGTRYSSRVVYPERTTSTTTRYTWVDNRVTSAPRVPQSSSSCRDREQHCGYWRDVGECQRNADFMRDRCPLSCSFCGQSSGRDNAVSYRHRRVPTSAPANIYQSPNRRYSFRTVNTRHTKTMSTNEKCVDRDLMCPYYHSINECEKNSAHMLQSCYLSCHRTECNYRGYLDVSPQDCQDKYSECESWARAGSCTTDLKMTWKCPRSCRICS